MLIGPPDRPGDDRRTRTDLSLRGLDPRVHLVDDQDGPSAWLAGLDVLVVPHREAPVPVGVLDAGNQGIPAVGFGGAGLDDVLPANDAPAAVVDRFDVAGLAERVETLLRDPHARQVLGSSLRARVARRHQAEACVQALWADVARHLARA